MARTTRQIAVGGLKAAMVSSAASRRALLCSGEVGGIVVDVKEGVDGGVCGSVGSLKDFSRHVRSDMGKDKKTEN